jgi:ribosomal protein S18 acetylase RimI-like enzyme
MRCRDATPEDAAGIGRVHVAAWRAAYGDAMPAAFLAGLDAGRAAERWRTWLRGGCPVLVADGDGDVAGFCRYGPSRDPEGGTVGEIIAINIDPAFWRRGLGRALLVETVARLRLDFAEVTLWVVRTNQRARAFYEALGWRADGAERVQSALTGSPIDEVRYRRYLTAPAVRPET